LFLLVLSGVYTGYFRQLKMPGNYPMSPENSLINYSAKKH